MVYVQVFRLSLDDSDDSISYSLGNSINNSLQKDKSHWADSSKQRPFSYTYASCYPVLNGQCVPKDGFYIWNKLKHLHYLQYQIYRHSYFKLFELMIFILVFFVLLKKSDNLKNSNDTLFISVTSAEELLKGVQKT